jgi:1,4-dihydroxy-2-naphthoate octaprenyltransferase
MIRTVFGEVLLFFVPFALFALFLILRRRNPLHMASWNDSTAWLAITGLVCVIAGFLYTGLTAERSTGAFEPPHLEDGRVVPGQFR